MRRLASILVLLGAAVVVPIASTPLPAQARVADAPSACTKAITFSTDRSVPVGRSGLLGCRFKTGGGGGGGYTDPTIAVSRKGVVFQAIQFGGIERSTDKGRHWTKIQVPDLPNGDSHAVGIHSFVRVDPRTDRLYYLTSTAVKSCGSSASLSAGAMVSWTDDLGKTWRGTPVSCDTYDWGRLVIGKAPAGNPYPSAVYFLGVGVRPIGGQRYVYRSLDGGKTFKKMTHIASASTEAGAGAAAPDGTLYFDYPEFLGFDPTRVADLTYPFKPQDVCKAMVAVSEDFGETWRQEALPGSMACYHLVGQERVSVDAAGTVYSVYSDDRDEQVYLTYSKDKGHTWSPRVNVMPPGAKFNNSYNNIVAGAAGHIVIASQNTPQTPNPKILINQGKGTYYTYLQESFDGTAAHPRFVSANLDTPSDPTYVDDEAPTETEVSMTIGPDGHAWVTFTRDDVADMWAADLRKAPVVRAVTPTKTPVESKPGAANESLAATGGSSAAALAALTLLAAAMVLGRAARRHSPTDAGSQDSSGRSRPSWRSGSTCAPTSER